MQAPHAPLMRRASVVVAVVGVLACGVWAYASFATANPSVAPVIAEIEIAPEPTAEGQGMRAFIDPETGELRAPTAEEVAESGLASAIAERTDVGLTRVERADGSTSVDLQGRYMSYAVARIADDGEVVHDCLDSSEKAAHFAAGHHHPHPSVEE
ncbi:MAG: hypothetical protein AAF604_08235 [Acidobacteriota bacterium]